MVESGARVAQGVQRHLVEFSLDCLRSIMSTADRRAKRFLIHPRFVQENDDMLPAPATTKLKTKPLLPPSFNWVKGEGAADARQLFS